MKNQFSFVQMLPLWLIIVTMAACTPDAEAVVVTRVVEVTDMLPTKPIFTLTPTLTAVAVSMTTETAVPEPTATATLAITPEPPCARPEAIAMAGVAVVLEPAPCLVWQDITNDETGFVVEFLYRVTGERFQQSLPANSQQWLLPPLLQPCDFSYQAQVMAVRPNDNSNQLIAFQDGVFACETVPAPEEAAQQLQDNLLWQEVNPNQYKLTGWDQGYRRSGGCGYGPYRWLDESHVMLFPIVGYVSFYEDPKGAQVTQPVVLNVETGELWTAEQTQTFRCESAVYSNALNTVVESSEGQVRIRNLAGEVLQTYPGTNPLFMGDTGYRLLAGGTWIDLAAGETIHLFGLDPSRLTNLAWTDEDTRFYDCCANYGDVATGVYYETVESGDIFPGGIEVSPDYPGEMTQWFDNGRYVMHQPGAVRWAYIDGVRDISLIPLIEPANESYINIGVELSLTETFDCIWEHYLRPLHDQIWLENCDTNLLVDVPALATQEVSGYRFVAWAPNGRFALMTNNDYYSLLDPDTMAFTSLPDVPATATLPIWSETADYLALTAEGRGVYWVVTAVGQSRFLVVEPTKFMTWHPETATLALALSDGTIHLITANERTDTNLTNAHSAVRDLRWSPHGHYLLFVSDMDIFVQTVD